ncbi:putative tail protein [Aeromonas phage vB_AhydM-H1]|nr:putative tail protein [Aeromonas phage vB_AhydM-H1]
MKGYSFDELVKLAMAAVKRAGDTMTGNLTAPKVLVSGAQGTEVNALTRKDYVDSAIAAGDALQVSKTGDTMTGNLNTPRVLVSGAQGAEGNALTRKDYVDTALANKLGNTGVQTINGELILNSHAPILILNETDTGKKWLFVADGYGFRFQMDSTDGTEGWAVNGAGSMTLRDPHTMTVQGNSASSLTRKDYVDSQVATRAPTAHTHTVAAITDLAPQDIAANTYTLALRDGAADIHARLLRTTFGDESRIDGAIAFRINNSTDNYTRYCNNPGAVRYWMNGVKTEWHMGWRAFIEDPSYPMTEYHIPNKAAVITYLSSDGVYRIDSSNGGGVSTGERLAIDASGNLYAKRGVHDTGVRVYSPNNPPPLVSHNHTAAQGNQDIVASGWGQIGTYMMAAVIPGHSGAMNPTATIAGSSLRPANCSEWGQNRDWALPGTWKCLGFVSDNNDDRWDDRTTLWIRIA